MFHFQTDLNEILPLNSSEFFAKSTLLPAPQLRPYIQSYTFLRAVRQYSQPIKWHIMPDASAYLIFHLIAPVKNPEQAIAYRFSFVGPRSVFEDIDRRNRCLTIMVRFRPGGFKPFCDFSISDILNVSVPVATAWGSAGKIIGERLFSHAKLLQLPHCIRVLEAALLSKLASSNVSIPLLQEAIRIIESGSGIAKISEIANRLGISARHLRNIVNHHIGLTPKQYSRIVRITHTLQISRRQWDGSWAGLAASGGFYDQAHMIDEFQELLGSSPETLLRRMS